jgi:hypothetical protein
MYCQFVGKGHDEIMTFCGNRHMIPSSKRRDRSGERALAEGIRTRPVRFVDPDSSRQKVLKNKSLETIFPLLVHSMKRFHNNESNLETSKTMNQRLQRNNLILRACQLSRNCICHMLTLNRVGEIKIRWNWEFRWQYPDRRRVRLSHSISSIMNSTESIVITDILPALQWRIARETDGTSSSETMVTATWKREKWIWTIPFQVMIRLKRNDIATINQISKQ